MIPDTPTRRPSLIAKPAPASNRSAWIYGFLLLCAVMLMRPSIEGEVFNPIGVLLFTFLSGLQFFTLPSRKPTDRSVIVAFTSVALFTFLALHSILNGAQSDFALRALLYIAAISLAGVMIASTIAYSRFLDCLIVFLIISAVSFYITCLLSYFFGLDSLVLFQLLLRSDTVGYADTAYVYFPFTIGYDIKNYPGLAIPRFAGGWREPGIAQALYCWALAYALASSRRWKKATIAMLVLGAVASQSTVAFLDIAVVVGLHILLGGKLTVKRVLLLVPGIIITSAFVYFGINDQNVGLASKVSNASYLDRTVAAEQSIRAFLDNPLGHGIYAFKFPNEGISLIANLGAIGLFGLVLIAVNWTSAVLLSNRPALMLTAMSPIFFTMITSQPLLDAPLFYLFLTIDAGEYSATSWLFGKRESRKKQQPEPLRRLVMQ